MRTIQLLAAVPLLVAAAIPIVASLYIAHRQAEDNEITYLTSLADEVLRRGTASRQQLFAALNALDRTPHPPCSPAALTQMQQLVGTSFYLQGVGTERDGVLMCSTLTQNGQAIPLTGQHTVTATGISTWIGARLPFAPDQPFNIYARNGHAVIIHPGLVIDLPVLNPAISLGLAISSPKTLIRSKGPLDTKWLDLYAPHLDTRIDDSTHHVVVRASKENNIAAIAAAPKALYSAALKTQAMILAPLGLVASALFAWGVVVLTRWQTSPNTRLRVALRRRELFMVYQPIVDLKTGAWVGAEALMRWRLSSGHMVPPDEFIAQAEQAGVISLLTRFAMDEVLRDLPDVLKVRPGFYMSINLSPQDLTADGPVHHLERGAADVGLPPGCLMLELTERGLLDVDAARPALVAARQMGASVALDDFGTGYSSLSMLESMDIDTLKIDRAFIASIGVQAAISPVTTHIIEMAKKLQLKMVAEGVETQEQADFLRERGVELAQGWLFAKPMTTTDLLKQLAT